LKTLKIINNEITEKEVKNAITKLKCKKAAGFDGITNEMIKASPSVINILTSLFNLILTSRHFPSQWNFGLIKNIHKGGNKDDPNNYRGITLNSSLGKLFCTILHQRLSNFCDENKIIAKEQAAFRKGYRTTDHIYLLKTIVKKYITQNKKLYTCFVDLEKAFDSVWRKALLHKIKKLGITGKIFDIIKSIYDTTTYSVIINGGKITPKSSSSRGIKQGDTLSTLLFNIYINDLPEYLSNDPNDPVIIDNTQLNSLMFADDLVLMSTTNSGLQQSIDNLSKYCKKWNLKINLKKTKIVTFSKTGKIEINNHNIDGKNIEKVTEYKYLGFVFTSNGSMTTGINRLAKQGQKAWFCIQRYLLGFKHKTIHTWLKLFDVLVKPILLYACEAWGEETNFNMKDASPVFKDSFEKLQLKVCKQILGVHRKTMNIPVLAELGRFPLKLSIDTQMIKYFIRFNNISKDRYLHKIYKESLKPENITKSKWFSHIKRIADEIGFSNIWINQVNERNCEKSPNDIAKKFLRRLKDIYSQNALRYINKDENTNIGKMQFLRQIKDTYSFEHYLNIENDQHRKSITQIRLSSHRLAIETGRWQKILRENRLCKYCNLSAIETESHFLFECQNYAEERTSMHIFIKEKIDIDFYDSPCSILSLIQKLKSLFKFGELSSLNSLGKYIFESFKIRDKPS
jgi:hypothetical protein